MFTVCRCLAAFLAIVGALHGQLTEWATTVAPGRCLLEVDVLSWSRDREAGQKYTTFGAASTFLTAGLTANWDVQVGAEVFINQKFEESGSRESQSGRGDVYLRTKWRFLESEETGTSMALLPYIKLPTNTGGVGNDSVEGGLIVPFQTSLPGECDFAAMVELDVVRNDRDDGYGSYWFASASLSRQVRKAIGLYAEATIGRPSGGAAWASTLGAGATFAMSESLWWDYSLSRGVSAAASDWMQVLRFNFEF